MVLGAGDCPVALLQDLVEESARSSCGACPPCRIGTGVMRNLLGRIGSGVADRADIERLERLATHIQRTSLCELGRNIATTVLAGLANGSQSVDDHLAAGGCPVEACRG